MSKAPKPVVIDAEELEAAPAVQDAPPVPDTDPIPGGAAMQAATRLAARRGSRLGRLFWAAAGALLALALGVWTWDFVTGLLTRNVLIGQVSLVLTVIVGLGLILFALREVAGMARLSRLDSLSGRAGQPEARTDRAVALAISQDMLRLYAPREELRLAAETLTRRQPEILDADAMLDATEQGLLAPLDALARREVEQAARQVATATALVPLALADVVIALAANLRMLRRIAEVYGGRAGTFGSWRLMRSVAQHLIATGAVALGDDLIGTIAGGGAVSKVSRRFGEGVVNGALTARVGIAAMEVCRPMPFRALPRPRVSSLVKRALAGLFVSGG